MDLLTDSVDKKHPQTFKCQVHIHIVFNIENLVNLFYDDMGCRTEISLSLNSNQ